MGQRFCDRCQKRHNTPTGKNCQKKIKVQPADLLRTVMEKEDNPPRPTTMMGDDTEIEFRKQVPPATPASLEERMTNMEQILGKISDSLIGSSQHERKSRSRHRSSSCSSVGSDDQSPRKSHRHHRSPSKSVNPLAYETPLFPDEDIRIAWSLSCVLLYTKTCKEEVIKSQISVMDMFNLITN